MGSEEGLSAKAGTKVLDGAGDGEGGSGMSYVALVEHQLSRTPCAGSAATGLV
jgi:hypothetical protein